ncbi:hypothetical protein Bbelb_377330 [Branchiostoma belcheri]|nr:hypothetical protein Bbelb_377330 [Branchiostoma belcheri]
MEGNNDPTAATQEGRQLLDIEIKMLELAASFGQPSSTRSYTNKPLDFVQVSQKKFSEAAASTLQKRSQRVNDFRDKISGGSGEEQMAAELRRLSRDRLLQVLQEGGFTQIRIPDGHLLGAKAGQCRSFRSLSTTMQNIDAPACYTKRRRLYPVDKITILAMAAVV